MSDFVHLHCHSEFSIQDGLLRMGPLCEAVKKQGMHSIALTDVCNLFGAIKFYQAAHKAGIKPIIGAEIWMAGEQSNTPYRLVLLCKNNNGYVNLCELITLCYREGARLNGVPFATYEWLEQHSNGLIALSAGSQGEVGQLIVSGQVDIARQSLERFKKIFNDEFYIEVCAIGESIESELNQISLQMASDLQVPALASNRVMFLNERDFGAHEGRVCVQSGYALNDVRRPKVYTKEQYLKSPEQMLKLFANYPQLVENAALIAKKCNLHLDLGKACLPVFPAPNQICEKDYLKQQANEGLERRLQQLFGEDRTKQRHYQERLDFELNVINQMGYPGYFLIVWDFIRWAKDQKIPVGPGRGSGAGSLVAYCLEITDLDPIAYELLFERFLNPERVSMPDFDIDFCMENRDRVIEYVAKRYGTNSVSQIATYGTMAAKAVVRDVGRILSHPYGFVDKIAKLIPFEIGMTLSRALEEEDLLQERYKSEEEVKALIDLAKKLEGITRNVGKHAGGVVIAPSNLTDFTPLYCEENSTSIVTQYDKDDVESAGLVKFDFLGLRTLTIIDWAIANANRLRAKDKLAPIDIADIELDDELTFKWLKKCLTTAVFQLESRGMKELIHRLQPDHFEEIIALVALFRPGPLQSGMVDDFINRKHGKSQVEYPHEDIAPILKPTYGVILYQEQVMQIAQVLAGYTLGGADVLRRAMGKKKPEEMAMQRKIFTEGAVNRGVEESVATYIFDLMEKFAGYGFNKSHSAAYALVSYQTAWVKAHYTSCYMAAVLSADLGNTEKVVILLEECTALGVEVKNPCINESDYAFTVCDTRSIQYGLGAIKGVGEGVIQELVKERTTPYKDLFDLCERLGGTKLNKRVLESLCKAGALDCFKLDRAVILASIENAMQYASKCNKDADAGQMDLFARAQKLPYPKVAPLDSELKLLLEKEVLGYYLSGHPMQHYQRELSQITGGNLERSMAKRRKEGMLAGQLIGIRTMITKRGDKMAFLNIEDQSARVEVAVFSNLFDEIRPMLEKDQILIIEVKINVDPKGNTRIRAEKIHLLNEARFKFGKGFCATLGKGRNLKKIVDELKSVEQHFPKGDWPLKIIYATPEGRVHLKLPKGYSFSPTQEVLDNLLELFGKQALSVVY